MCLLVVSCIGDSAFLAMLSVLCSIRWISHPQLGQEPGNSTTALVDIPVLS